MAAALPSATEEVIKAMSDQLRLHAEAAKFEKPTTLKSKPGVIKQKPTKLLGSHSGD
jgi:hypothetical protein